MAENPLIRDLKISGFKAQNPLLRGIVEEQSNFQKVLENVNRAGFGGVNVARNLIQSSKGEAELDPLGAFKRGVTLEEKPFFGEVLKQDLDSDQLLANLGIDPGGVPGKVLTGIAGFAGDVLLDPITYVPAGVFAKFLKGASRATGLSAAGRGLAKVPAIAQVGETLGTLFRPGSQLRKVPGFKNLVNQTDTLLRNRQGDIVKEVLELSKGVRPEQTKLITKFLETSDFLTRKALRSQIAQEGLTGRTLKVKRILSNWANTENKLGILPNIKEFYSPHILKENARRVGTSLSKPLTAKPGFAKHRGIEGIIEDINLNLGKEFFENNIFKALGMRGLAHSRAVTAKEFVNNTLAQFGRKVKLGDNLLSNEGLYVAKDFFRRSSSAFEKSVSVTPKPIQITAPLKRKLKQDFKRLGKAEFRRQFPLGDKSIDEFIEGLQKAGSNIPELFLNRGAQELLELPPEGAIKFIASTKGASVFAMPREIAEHMNTFRSTFINEESTKQFLRGYDSILNLWKGYSTGANLGFHGRNFISNHWQGFLMNGPEVFNPVGNSKMAGVLISQGDSFNKVFPIAGNALKKQTIDLGKLGKMSYDDFFKLAKDKGIINTGWLGADIPMLVDKQLELGLTNSLKRTLTAVNPLSKHNILMTKGRALGTNIENHARLMNFYLDLSKTGDATLSAIKTKKFFFDYNELTLFEKNVMKRIVPFYSWMRKNIPLQFEQLLKQPAKYTGLLKAKGEIEREIDLPKHMPDFVRSGFPIFTSEDMKGRPQAFLLRNFIPAVDIEQVIGRGAEIAPGTKVPEIVRTIISSIGPQFRSPVEQALNLNLFFGRPIERFPGETEPILGVPVRRRVAKELPRPFGEVTRLIGQRKQEVGLDQPAVPARLLRFVTGLKGFPVDEQKVKSFAKFKKSQKEREIKSSLRRAIKKKDKANVDRALKALKKLKRSK